MHRSDPDARRTWLLSQQSQAANWTSTLRRAGNIARAIRSERPCNYGPWQNGFRQIGTDWMDLSIFASNTCLPPWPNDCPSLVEFALTFLEEDPMLFRSGYTKRHFAKRLGQYPLNAVQIARIDTVFRRAVIEGAGLEEFRAYCKLAAKLRPDGLEDWLIVKAAGAQIRSFTLHNSDFSQVNTFLSLAEYSQLVPTNVWGNPKCAVTFNPDPAIHPMTEQDWADPANKTRVNAWRMLRAIQRRNSQSIWAPLYGKNASDSGKSTNA